MANLLFIPTSPGVPFYTQRTKLDGRDYNLRFSWNERLERWALDILTANDDPIAVGIKLIARWPLTRFLHWDERMPPGDLVVNDVTSGDGAPPGLFDLGEGLRCELIYIAVTSG